MIFFNASDWSESLPVDCLLFVKNLKCKKRPKHKLWSKMWPCKKVTLNVGSDLSGRLWPRCQSDAQQGSKQTEAPTWWLGGVRLNARVVAAVWWMVLWQLQGIPAICPSCGWGLRGCNPLHRHLPPATRCTATCHLPPAAPPPATPHTGLSTEPNSNAVH